MNTETSMHISHTLRVKCIILTLLHAEPHPGFVTRAACIAAVQEHLPHAQPLDIDRAMLELECDNAIGSVVCTARPRRLYYICPYGHRVLKELRDSFEDAHEPHDAELNTPGEPGDFMQRLVALESKVQQLIQDLSTLTAR